MLQRHDGHRSQTQSARQPLLSLTDAALEVLGCCWGTSALRQHACQAALLSIKPRQSTVADSQSAWLPAVTLQGRRRRVLQRHDSHRSR